MIHHVTSQFSTVTLRHITLVADWKSKRYVTSYHCDVALVTCNECVTCTAKSPEKSRRERCYVERHSWQISCTRTRSVSKCSHFLICTISWRDIYLPSQLYLSRTTLTATSPYPTSRQGFRVIIVRRISNSIPISWFISWLWTKQYIFK